MDTKPLYLLGDSRLLFSKKASGEPFFSEIPGLFPGKTPKAAYIGVSNGDQEAFFELFRGFMSSLGITDCTHIKESFTKEETSVLEVADIIMLAGGDTWHGWELMQKHQVSNILSERYVQGALLMGVSAGAIQLSWQVYRSDNEGGLEFRDGLKFAPFLISAHEEDSEWPGLQALVAASASMSRGIGLPFGGGIKYLPDGSVDVLGEPCTEIVNKEGEISSSILLPSG